MASRDLRVIPRDTTGDTINKRGSWCVHHIAILIRLLRWAWLTHEYPDTLECTHCARDCIRLDSSEILAKQKRSDLPINNARPVVRQAAREDLLT